MEDRQSVVHAEFPMRTEEVPMNFEWSAEACERPLPREEWLARIQENPEGEDGEDAACFEDKAEGED